MLPGKFNRCAGAADLLIAATRQECATTGFVRTRHTGITPAAHRAASSHARPLSALAAPCCGPPLASLLGALRASFPPVEACLAADKEGCGGHGGGATAAGGLRAGGGGGSKGIASGPLGLVQRPRLLLCGPEGSGQAHVAPALLHALEGLPIHAIGLPSLLADAGARCVRAAVAQRLVPAKSSASNDAGCWLLVRMLRGILSQLGLDNSSTFKRFQTVSNHARRRSLEEALVHAFVEARRSAPALLYLPHLPLWWATAPPALRAALLMLLEELPPDLPLLLVAVADAPAADIDPEVCACACLPARALPARALPARALPATAQPCNCCWSPCLTAPQTPPRSCWRSSRPRRASSSPRRRRSSAQTCLR